MAKVRPVVSEVDGVASPSRKQAVQVFQGQAAWVEWIIREPDGNPADLTEIGFAESSASSESESGSAIVLRVVECLSINAGNPPIELSGETLAASQGLVRAKLTSAVVTKPGIYQAEWAVYSADGELEHVVQGSIIVNRGLSGSETANVGPPTVAEIRLHLRDSGPEDNYLLDTVEYDLAELAACIERPVQVWNETLEFVNRRYNTSNFPYRSKWLDAIVGYLHLLAAQNYDRNKQEYTAGGTSMNDKARGPLYLQKGMMLLQEYKDWVKIRKGQINMESGFGSTSERY